ncbi:hypothetical protein IMZ48_02395 [Candidatus Bathyarchaeota archaeon]|nr:hypothetical protein [Candidatus Bathyarchaeota archaeon]
MVLALRRLCPRPRALPGKPRVCHFSGLTVTNPFQDEVFHIPQAQKYCDAKWLEWDDKITTPPGL